MKAFILRRVVLSVITLLGVSFVAFFFLHLIPGDAARIVAGVEATEDEVSSLRTKLGLDQPLFRQYLNYVSRAFRGDLGESLRTGKPITVELGSRLPVTLTLTLSALMVTVFLGVPVGIVSALHRGLWQHLSFFLLLSMSCMPVFWTGMLLVLTFAVWRHWLPPGGSDGPSHFVLPGLALGVSSAGLLARMVRSGMNEVLASTYIRTARAKGLSPCTVTCKHATRNALLPVVTVLGLQFGELLGGAILVETLFALNGIGRYLVLSIAFRDYPAVQGSVFFIASAFIAVNTLVDILYGIIDPRIRW